MKTKKTIKIIIIVLLAIIFLPCVLITLLSVLGVTTISLAVLIYELCTQNPDVKELRYDEVPFELVYEYNGNAFESGDGYVCEYI